MHDKGDLVRPRRDDLAWRRVGGEAVLLDLRSNVYLSINETGTFLWDRMQDGATQAELAAALAERYELAQETADADVSEFIAVLRQRQFLDSDD